MLRLGKAAQTDRTGADIGGDTFQPGGLAEGSRGFDHRVDQAEEQQAEVIRTLQGAGAMLPGGMKRGVFGAFVENLLEGFDETPMLELAGIDRVGVLGADETMKPKRGKSTSYDLVTIM